MPRVILTGSIQEHAGGLGTIDVNGTTAAEAVKALEVAFPALRGWVVDERGALRRHVRLFLRHEAISLDAPVGPDDELHIVAAISGGRDMNRIARGYEERPGRAAREAPGGPLEMTARAFPGEVVEFATRDPRNGRYFAAVTHGQFGPHLFYTDDPTGKWGAGRGPRLPARRRRSRRADLGHRAGRG